MTALAERAQEALRRNRYDAMQLVQSIGLKQTQKLLQDAASDLEKRINQKVKGLGNQAFTIVQMRATLIQVKDTLDTVTRNMKKTVVETGRKASEKSAQNTIDYLKKADKAFRGVGQQGLALREASMFERATRGTESSILHRLSSSKNKRRKQRIGVLQRYDMETIAHFEHIMKRGIVTKMSFNEMKREIRESSPFLKQAPAFWAERIVRTEGMAAYNAAGWHSIREANRQLGDMTKILSATFDDRTGSDSFAVHGQIRRPEEAFESWYGAYQHPPNRPNDREVVVPHRISWEIPESLQQLDDEQVLERWHEEGHKQPIPERPLMTTVDLELFGQPQHRQLRSAEGVDESESD